MPSSRRSTSATRRGFATVVPTSAFGYDASVTPYPYDPDRARQLLSEAGYPNGFSVEFDSFTGSIADHSKPAEAIVEYLRQVGIDVKLNVFEFGAFGPRRVANQTSPLHIYSIGNVYFEPAWQVKWMMQQNLGLFYRNEEVYAMMSQAEATFEPNARIPIYSQRAAAAEGRRRLHLPLPERRRVRDEPRRSSTNRDATRPSGSIRCGRRCSPDAGWNGLSV